MSFRRAFSWGAGLWLGRLAAKVGLGLLALLLLVIIGLFGGH